MKDKLQQTKTIKEFQIKFKGYDLIIPIGSTVTNMTAMGPDNAYHFWQDFHEYAERISGFKDSILKHDLTYYGINIPAEYCEPYETK